jgi:hypothetical protein
MSKKPTYEFSIKIRPSFYDTTKGVIILEVDAIGAFIMGYDSDLYTVRIKMSETDRESIETVIGLKEFKTELSKYFDKELSL